MKKINIILYCGLLLITSCGKFLDVKPVGKLIPSEVKDFAGLLHSEQTINYHLVSDNNMGSSLTGLSEYVYLDDKVIKYFYTPSIVILSRLAGYSFQTPYLNFDKTDKALSSGCYKAVGIFNNIIDGVTGLEKENDIYGQEVIAQAKAGRAWSLLVTGMSYGPSYNPSSTNDTKTIPYRKDGDPTSLNPDRATVEELYQNVQNDLEYAAEYAPLKTKNPVLANRATANALLAFMYMNKNDFANMYKYSKIAWEMQLQNYNGDASNLIYNYNDFEYEIKTPAPSVPEGADVETKLNLKSPDNLHTKTYHKENMLFRTEIKGLISIRPSEKYLSLFSDGDMRKKLFLLKYEGFTKIVNVTNEEGGTDKVKVTEGIIVNISKSSKMKVSMGLTHPELLLMYAESAARLNKSSEAMEALRLLRTFRYSPDKATITDLSGDDLIQEILNERSRELPLFTPHRFWDLKRFAREENKPWAQKSISRVIMGKTETAEINSEKFQLEIANSYRIDNEHWNLPIIQGTWSPYKW